MEKVTLTKLYEVLAQKVGRSEAECLTQYVEIKVRDELNTKTEILATRVFVKDECLAIKENIHALRSELKGDIHALRNEVTAGIHTLRNEMKEHSLSQQKWMLSIFITVVIMIMGLYATFLFKH
jgi:dynactin complex subunit